MHQIVSRVFQPILAGATLRGRLIGCLGALFAIGLTGFFSHLVVGSASFVPLIVAPIGASAVLLFALPASPLAQPWPVIGGNVIATVVGVAVSKIIPDPVVASGVAVSLAILAMSLTRSLHPPGGAAALTAVKTALTSADIPFNEGLKRPVKITAPSGSLVNPTYPAPVRARMEAGYRCFNAVLKALAQVAPTQVIAGGNDATLVTSLSHQTQGKYRVYLEIYGGGFGASDAYNGCDAVDSPLSNCTNTPIEATDMEFSHFRITGYGLIPDSCGHGKHRGGLGFYRRFEILEDHVNFAIYADRFRIAPYGLFGGTDGQCGHAEVVRDGKVIALKSKDGMMLQKADVLTIYTAGGGGYGAPELREEKAVAYDLQHGYLTAQTAREQYSF